MKLRIILPNLSSSNLVPSKIVCFDLGRPNLDLKTSQQNVLENLYTIIEVMTEFVAVNTKRSTKLTKALVFNFFFVLSYTFNFRKPHMKTRTRKR